MNKQEAKKRIEKLKKTINYHRYLYHVKDTQDISDAALDSLKHELKELEDKFPDLKKPDSPTQRIGGEALDKFEKVEHSSPMLSIEDVFGREELVSWKDYITKLVGNSLSYFCEVKVDGLALALRYSNGVLTQAATRGDGRVGEDVTENAKTIESIPLRLELHEPLSSSAIQKNVARIIKNGTLEVRGEVYIGKNEFEDFNKERARKGEETYANPRNLAAGSVRQLDPGLTASRPLAFLAYDIITDVGEEKHSEEHEILPKLGFPTDPTACKCEDVDCVYNYWKEIVEKRTSIPYQIDGVVITVNDNNTFKELGVAGKSPRGIRAFKFAPKQATTVVKDIKTHVGRTGAVTPIAVLKSVQIGGVTVSRASLHNFDEIERLDVRIGDTVIVERAGDVIPKVVRVIKDLRPKNARKFKPPEKCPRCEAKLVKKEGEAIWYCPDPNCPSRKHEYLNYFVSGSAFDIDGLGPKIMKQLMDADLVSDPVDIFTLEKGDIESLPGFQEKSAQNIVNSIESSKAIPLWRFLVALNIKYVGGETAIDLAQKFGSIKELEKASLEDIRAIDGIGEVVAESIHEWFSKKENRNFIESLKKAGVKIIPPKKQGTKLEGMTFVFTGSFESMARSEAEKKVRELGGDPASSVSGETDYLVVGENPGSKNEDAQKLDVKIIDEEEFLKIINNQ